MRIRSSVREEGVPFAEHVFGIQPVFCLSVPVIGHLKLHVAFSLIPGDCVSAGGRENRLPMKRELF